MKRLGKFDLEIVSIKNDYTTNVSHIFLRSWNNYATDLFTFLPHFLNGLECIDIELSWHHLVPHSNCLQISFTCAVKENGEILWKLYQQLSPTA